MTPTTEPSPARRRVRRCVADSDRRGRHDQGEGATLHVQEGTRVANEPHRDPADPLPGASSLPRQQLSGYHAAQVQQCRKGRRVTYLPEGDREVHPYRDVLTHDRTIPQKSTIEHLYWVAA